MSALMPRILVPLPATDAAPEPAGEQLVTFRPIPFARFQAELLELYKPPLRAKGTYRMMRAVLETAGGLLGADATTEHLTPSLVARFIAACAGNENPNTTYGKLSYLRAACSHAEQAGYLRSSPFRIRRRWFRRVTPRDKKHHSREEIARVLALLSREVQIKTGYDRWYAVRLYALIATVAYTGLRRDEALYLRTDDVNLEARLLLIRSRRQRETKTEASAQPVAMPPALVPILAAWLPRLILPRSLEGAPRVDAGWVFPNMHRTGPWTGGASGYKPLDAVRKAGERAGVRDFTFLSLRHSWGTHAEHWGLSDAQIQRQLRHTNTQTQWHYRHAEAQNMREAVVAVDFGPAAELS